MKILVILYVFFFNLIIIESSLEQKSLNITNEILLQNKNSVVKEFIDKKKRKEKPQARKKRIKAIKKLEELISSHFLEGSINCDNQKEKGKKLKSNLFVNSKKMEASIFLIQQLGKQEKLKTKLNKLLLTSEDIFSIEKCDKKEKFIEKITLISNLNLKTIIEKEKEAEEKIKKYDAISKGIDEIKPKIETKIEEIKNKINNGADLDFQQLEEEIKGLYEKHTELTKLSKELCNLLLSDEENIIVDIDRLDYWSKTDIAYYLGLEIKKVHKEIKLKKIEKAFNVEIKELKNGDVNLVDKIEGFEFKFKDDIEFITNYHTEDDKAKSEEKAKKIRELQKNLKEKCISNKSIIADHYSSDCISKLFQEMILICSWDLKTINKKEQNAKDRIKEYDAISKDIDGIKDEIQTKIEYIENKPNDKTHYDKTHLEFDSLEKEIEALYEKHNTLRGLCKELFDLLCSDEENIIVDVERLKCWSQVYIDDICKVLIDEINKEIKLKKIEKALDDKIKEWSGSDINNKIKSFESQFGSDIEYIINYDTEKGDTVALQKKQKKIRDLQKVLKENFILNVRNCKFDCILKLFQKITLISSWNSEKISEKEKEAEEKIKKYDEISQDIDGIKDEIQTKIQYIENKLNDKTHYDKTHLEFDSLEKEIGELYEKHNNLNNLSKKLCNLLLSNEENIIVDINRLEYWFKTDIAYYLELKIKKVHKEIKLKKIEKALDDKIKEWQESNNINLVTKIEEFESKFKDDIEFITNYHTGGNKAKSKKIREFQKNLKEKCISNKSIIADYYSSDCISKLFQEMILISSWDLETISEKEKEAEEKIKKYDEISQDIDGIKDEIQTKIQYIENKLNDKTDLNFEQLEKEIGEVYQKHNKLNNLCQKLFNLLCSDKENIIFDIDCLKYWPQVEINNDLKVLIDKINKEIKMPEAIDGEYVSEEGKLTLIKNFKNENKIYDISFFKYILGTFMAIPFFLPILIDNYSQNLNDYINTYYKHLNQYKNIFCGIGGSIIIGILSRYFVKKNDEKGFNKSLKDIADDKNNKPIFLWNNIPVYKIESNNTNENNDKYKKFFEYLNSKDSNLLNNFLKSEYCYYQKNKILYFFDNNNNILINTLFLLDLYCRENKKEFDKFNIVNIMQYIFDNSIQKNKENFSNKNYFGLSIHRYLQNLEEPKQ